MKICVWPNGVWCEPSDLDGYLGWMSDDYEVIEVDGWDETGEPVLPARFKLHNWRDE